MRRHPFPTRQLTNETAANVAKLLNLMTRMPDAQVEYLFDNECAYLMMAVSEDMVKKAEAMIEQGDDWYPGCGEPADGRESVLGEMRDKDDPCWNCGQLYTACGVCEHRRKDEA
jgi:hypothetical protein